MNPRGLVAILASFAAAIVVLAVTSTYSAYVSSTNHKNSCASRAIVITFTPASGQTLTPHQVAGIQAVESKAFIRLDQALC